MGRTVFRRSSCDAGEAAIFRTQKIKSVFQGDDAENSNDDD